MNDIDITAVVTLLSIPIGLVIAFIARRAAIKERARQQAWAAQQGWQFTERDDSLAYRWGCPPFGVGSRQRAYNVITGVYRNTHICSFGYQYTISTGSGKNRRSRTYHFHIIVMRLPRYLPAFAMAPENLATRIAGKIGFKDIQFESPDFNHAWNVQAEDERYAYGIVTPQFMEWAMHPYVQQFGITIAGADALTCWGGPPNVDNVLPSLDVLLDFTGRIPRHTWEDYGR